MRSDWVKAAVGCYWIRGEYAIATVSGGDESSGYLLFLLPSRDGRPGQQIGERRYATFEAAEAVSREHEKYRTAGGKE